MRNIESPKKIISCSKCNSRAIIHLPYSGQSLCKKHFFLYFEKRVKRTIGESKMLEGVKHLGVAVSGGKDSLSMLYVLKQITGPMKIRLTAILVDEGISGYRDRTAKNAIRICRQLDIPLKVYSFKEEIGISMDQLMKRKREFREVSCTYCGVFRRRILNKAARELKCDKLAIGHNMDDVIQSFLMNLIRNEPFRLARFGSTSGILNDDKFIIRIRPLYKIPEKESAIYAFFRGLRSEFFPCPYYEEAFRHRVRDFINEIEALYPGTKFKLFSSYDNIKHLLADKFNYRKTEKIAKCLKCGEPSSGAICKACTLLDAVGQR